VVVIGGDLFISLELDMRLQIKQRRLINTNASFVG